MEVVREEHTSLHLDLRKQPKSGDYLQLMTCEDTATTWRPVLNAKRQEVVF